MNRIVNSAAHLCTGQVANTARTVIIDTETAASADGAVLR